MVATTSALDALFALPDALACGPEVDRLFLAAMQEVLAHHYADSDVYRGLCDLVGFGPDDLRSVDDLPRVPWLLVDVFKRYDLLSIPREQIATTFTSSGTSGQKSHISIDQASWDRQTAMRHNIMASLGLISPDPVNYLCFSYDEQTGGQGQPRAPRVEGRPVPGRDATGFDSGADAEAQRRPDDEAGE